MPGLRNHPAPLFPKPVLPHNRTNHPINLWRYRSSSFDQHNHALDPPKARKKASDQPPLTGRSETFSGENFSVTLSTVFYSASSIYSLGFPALIFAVLHLICAAKSGRRFFTPIENHQADIGR